ncbi:hypothetical protein FSW04_17080 [Baekduia soli]|uniref:Uncharacterized protein n=1 Tax=Baekduia soli TaxID=496014 RepID=A0A5B8U7X9_9ACTN|nr:hypothetical protein [Baekduia soli]QEC49120.1 hypothetical protein FSW04_17080 [Baekduia soli]
MTWKLHDPQHRAVITPFASRQEAERWRDAHGLDGLFAVAQDAEAVPPAAGRPRPATPRRGHTAAAARERRRRPAC